MQLHIRTSTVLNTLVEFSNGFQEQFSGLPPCRQSDVKALAGAHVEFMSKALQLQVDASAMRGIAVGVPIIVTLLKQLQDGAPNPFWFHAMEENSKGGL
jgi:hypothetical protein